MSAFNAYLVNLGLETLHLRMERHSENALAVAKYLKRGASGLLTFGIKGGIEEAKKFCKELNLVALAVTLGDTRSCILHPATTTHSQLGKEDKIASGVTPDMLRLSVGIESSDDIINDIKNSLNKI